MIKYEIRAEVNCDNPVHEGLNLWRVYHGTSEQDILTQTWVDGYTQIEIRYRDKSSRKQMWCRECQDRSLTRKD